jgi:PAS domain S-box-containing protein
MDRAKTYSDDYVRAMEVLLQSAPGGIFSYAQGFDDQFSFISENMLAFLGYTNEEFTKKFANHFSLMVYKDDRERVLQEIDDQIRIRPFDTCEYRIEKKDGSLVWVHDEGHLVSDQSGKKWFYVVIVDITSTLHKQEEERQKFHQTVQGMLQANPDAMGIIQVNLTQNTCEEAHVNSPLCANVANLKDYDDFLQRIASLIPTKEDRARFAGDFSRLSLQKAFKEGRDSFSTEYFRCDLAGERHWIRTSVRMLQNPISLDIEAVLCSFDISQEKLWASLNQIMMKQEYDFIGLLRPKEGKIEALHLSPDCPKPYWEFFKKEMVFVDFSGMRNNSALNWVDPDFVSTYIAATEPKKILEELSKDDHYEVLAPGHNKDGSVIYRKLQHYLLGDGSDSVLIFDSDVTQLVLAQKKEAEAAKTAAEQVQNIMDTITVGVSILLMKDPDHVEIRYVNR